MNVQTQNYFEEYENHDSKLDKNPSIISKLICSKSF